MDRPTAGVLRLLRTAVVATLVLALAAIAHVAAGGTLHAGLGTAAAGVAVAVAVHATTRVRLGTPALLTVLGLGQLLLHSVFGALDAAAQDPGRGRADQPTAGHDHDGLLHLAALGDGQDTAGLAVPAPMLLAHVVATVLTAVVLARAEATLWRLWAWLTPRWTVLARAATTVGTPARRTPTTDAPVVRPRILPARHRTRRGPPGLLACPTA